MKKIYLLSLVILLNFIAHSQSNLTGTWYLHHLNIDGNQINLPNNQPPYFDDYNFLSLVFYDTDNNGNNINDIDAFGPCDSLHGDYTATNSSINLFNVVQTLGGCGGGNSVVYSFESNFHGIWQSNLTYSILGSNNETLIISNALGNQAVYGRNTVLQDDLLGEWFLYSATVDDETLSFLDINYFSNIVFSESQFYGNVCEYFSGNYFIDSSNRINITYFVHTLGCVLPPPPTGYEYSLFYEVLTNNDSALPSILDYTITGTGDDETLVLTDFEGDIAIYGRQTLSRKSFEAFNKLTIYPNPIKEQFNIKGLDKNRDYYYSIISLTGQTIVFNKHLNNTIVDVNSLESGIYFIQIENDVSAETIKLIKE